MLNRLVKVLSSIKNSFKINFIKLKLKNPKFTHLYIGTPYYGNLGDQQIRNSAIEFLKNHNIKFIELSALMYYKLIGHKFPHIKTICLQGGGNLGDIYPYDEYLRDDVIRRYKDKKIILFPQTLHYIDETEDGDFSTTKNIFKKHKNLVLVAREKVSYNKMKEIFSQNKVLLTPDIVLSSDYTKKFKNKRKNKALFLMRKDIEKHLDNKIIDSMRIEVSKKFKVVDSDTVLNFDVYDILRDYELKKIFKLVTSSKIVITDRLHGMIFCAITQTPCIVFSNNNHKIKSTYQNWLSENKYISYVDEPDKLDILNEVEKITNKETKFKALDKEFNPLAEEL